MSQVWYKVYSTGNTLKIERLFGPTGVFIPKKLMKNSVMKVTAAVSKYPFILEFKFGSLFSFQCDLNIMPKLIQIIQMAARGRVDHCSISTQRFIFGRVLVIRIPVMRGAESDITTEPMTDIVKG